MVVAKTPNIVKALYSQLTWELPNNENKIYLTFDDGPKPGVTNWVLDILKQFNVNATFFCLGQNVEKHPELFQRIIQEGHAIGNHSYSHPSGWTTKNKDYFEDVEACQKLVNSNLFRPPYGRISKAQAKHLGESYQIIMWNVLSGDYDAKITPEQCLNNVIKNTQAGSIIVFHDSEKATNNLKFALPKAIEKLLVEGFVFESLRKD